MDLQSYFRIVARRWKTITILTLACALLAAGITLVQPKSYASRLTFFVSTSSSDNNSQLEQGGTFTQERVKSYAQLLRTRRVLDPVASDLKLQGGRTTLLKEISASVPSESVLIAVSVTDHSPKRAQAIAQRLAESFPQVVDELEATKKEQSPIKVSVVGPPTPSDGAVAPMPLPNILLGTLLGLLLGLAVAILRDRLDTLLRTKDDVEQATDVTVIGGVPFDADAADHPLIIQADPHSARAEALRSVRTGLQFMDADREVRSLVVTSSIAGEGKTTTAANLAIALAEAGSSVCIIEGDLRRPRLLRYLGMEGSVGLSDVIIGRAGIDDVLQPFGRLRMAVIGAGELPPNPSELLGSESMRRTLKTLSERFDYVIIDAPPLLPVTDAAVSSTMVDGTVVVVGAGITHRGQLTAGLEMLERVNARVLGLVMNRVARASSKNDYYDYRYEYTQDDRAPEKATSRLDRRVRGRRARS